MKVVSSLKSLKKRDINCKVVRRRGKLYVINKKKHYSIASKQFYSIIELAKLFKIKIRYLPMRKGERFASALTRMNLNNRIVRLSAKIRLSDYVNNFLMNNH